MDRIDDLLPTGPGGGNHAVAGAERARNRDERWLQLFNNMAEGFVLGELVRDPDGRAADWRCLEVNQAWTELTGLPREAAVGGLGRDLLPNDGGDWLVECVRAVETGEAQDFSLCSGARQRWYKGRCFRTEPERFGVIFRDVTPEIQHGRRQAALIELGDLLRECPSTSEMMRLASEVVGTTLDASRAGYGYVDAAAETVDIEQGWSAPGVGSVAGPHRFSDYGRLRHWLASGEPLVISDVRQDERTAEDPSPLLAIGVGALVNMPVRERGQTVGVFFVHKSGPHRWTEDEVNFLRKVADRVQVGAARLRAEEQQQLINNEIAHRLKNQLAIVQAVASQTLRQATDLRTANDALSFRLAAMARATDVLMGADQSGAELHQLARTALGTHGSLVDRFRLSGPRIRFDPQISLALTLAFHELATNAVKYGALSNDTGHVDLSWAVTMGPDGGEPRFTLQWQEVGGPTVQAPDRRGFGSVMIERSLRAYFRGETALFFEPAGLEFRIDAPFNGINMEGQA